MFEQISIFDYLNMATNKPVPYYPHMHNERFAKCPNCGSRVIEFSKPERCEECGYKLDWTGWGKNYIVSYPSGEKDCKACKHRQYNTCNFNGDCIRFSAYEERKTVIGYCHATLDPCNRENLTPVARDLGMKCEAPCCAGCPERKECGAACNYSHRY